MKIFLTLVFCCFLWVNLSAQVNLENIKPDDIIVIKLEGGTEVIGRLISTLNDRIIIESNTLGRLDILLNKITEIHSIDEIKSYDSNPDWFDNPSPNKNFVTETAIGLKEGESHYQNAMLGANIYSYGISDRFSLGGGIELFSIFSGESPALMLSPKYTIPNKNDNIHFGVGSNLILAPDGPNRDIAGSIYGLTTFGNKDHNFTLGIGFAFYENDITDTPVIQIGGMTRIRKNMMLVTDHILVSNNSDSVFTGSFTLRFISRMVSIDVGVGTAYNHGSIPVLGFGLKL